MSGQDGYAWFTRVYRRNVRVAHLVGPGTSHGEPMCPARSEHGWLGTGSQWEYEHAATLPLCGECKVIADAGRAASGQGGKDTGPMGEGLRDARGVPFDLVAGDGCVALVQAPGILRFGPGQRDAFELAWLAAWGSLGVKDQVVQAGPLSVTPLAMARRRPGTGAAEPVMVTAGGTRLGDGWTARADPVPSAEWTPCLRRPDLGYLAASMDVVLEHPEHGAVTVPPGSWLLTITRAGGL
jgi:hypothetical protein